MPEYFVPDAHEDEEGGDDHERDVADAQFFAAVPGRVVAHCGGSVLCGETFFYGAVGEDAGLYGGLELRVCAETRDVCEGAFRGWESVHEA